MPIQAFAGANIQATVSWQAAQASRTWMDVGGVWNGSSDVYATQGETVTYSMFNNNTNIATNTAYKLRPAITLPTGFHYVANTATVTATGTSCVATTPSVTSVSSLPINPYGTLAFNLNNYHLNGQCTLKLKYGVYADKTVVSGTYQLLNYWDYATTSTGTLTALNRNKGLNILVLAGATVVSKLPINQTLAVDAYAHWTLDVQNTGLGGLFDVVVDEYTIDPSLTPSASLSLSSMTVTVPATGVLSPKTAQRKLAYLAPNAHFTSDVYAQVTGCRNINNTAYLTERNGLENSTATAQVTLNKLLPVIGLTVNPYTLSYNASKAIRVTIQNTGTGAASGFFLQTDLYAQGMTVTVVDSAWSYSATTDQFTYTAGTIGKNSTLTLTFNVQAANVCLITAATHIAWTAHYKDPCGDTYQTPSRVGTLNQPSVVPSVTLSNQSVDQYGTPTNRLIVGKAYQYLVKFSVVDVADIYTTPFVVTDTLPSNITAVNITAPTGTTFSCPTATCVAGDKITWNITSGATLPVTLPIAYTAPSSTCLGGQVLKNIASLTTAKSVQNCSLNATATSSPLLTNLLGASVTQSFNVGTSLSGINFETGLPRAGVTRAATEGESIPLKAVYTFGTGAGTWTGSIFTDDFSLATGTTLVPNTLTYQINTGAVIAVPNTSVTCGTGTVAAGTCSKNISIKLDFLSGVNGGNVAGQTLTIQYSVTMPDAALGASATTTRTELTKLILANGTGGCVITGQPQAFTQGAFIPIARAKAQLSLAMPSTIDVCQPVQATMSIANVTDQYASHVLASFPTNTNYKFLTVPSPTYTGVFAGAGNTTYTPTATGGSTFALVPKLNASGTIKFTLQLNATTVAQNTPIAVSTQMTYDDYQTINTVLGYFSTTATAMPSLVRKGLLAVSLTPQRYTVAGTAAAWKVYLTNIGNGTTFGATLNNTLPVGIGLDKAATDLSNIGQCGGLAAAACLATVSGQNITWALGDIPPGSTRTIQLKTVVNAATCSLPNNQVSATWGCGATTLGPGLIKEPAFLFPAGQMQVVHDTTQSFAPLCGQGTDEIIIRNTGTPDILDVYVQEVLNTASTGISFQANTVEYRTNKNATWLPALSPPTGTGVTADPYTWGKIQIPPLADLYSATGTGVNEVRIRFKIKAGEQANNAPTISASGKGRVSCGSAVTSPGTSYAIPVRKPNIIVTKTGRNLTANAASAFASTVFGGKGDTVEWQVRVQNTGSMDAYTVRLQDTFAGSGATTMTVQSSPTPFVTSILNQGIYSAPNIPKNITQTYTFREVLGAKCAIYGSQNTAKVSWGCQSQGINTHSTFTMPSSTAKAALVMVPGFGDFSTSTSAQVFTTIRDTGGAKATAYFYNGGGSASHIDIYGNLPANMQLDPYGSILLQGTAVNTVAGACNAPKLCLTGAVTLAGTPTKPIFSLAGTGIRHASSATLTYYLMPKLTDDLYASVYPDLSKSEPNNATAPYRLDPAASVYAGNVDLTLHTSDTCQTAGIKKNSKLLTPLMPDLDMTVSPAYAIVSDGNNYNFDFNFSNVGPANSVAKYMAVTFPVVGGGLTVNSVNMIRGGSFAWSVPFVCWLKGYAGVPGCNNNVGMFGFYKNSVNTGNMTVRVNVTVHDNGQPLTLMADVTGKIASDNYGKSAVAPYPIPPLFGNYSHDRAAPRILGLNFKKTLVKTSETFTADPYVAIGEEVTYDLYARFFGGDTALASTGGVFKNMVMRDTLPSGLGLVSLVAQANNTAGTVATGSATPASVNPLKSGVLDLTMNPYASTTVMVLDYYVTARVLNTSANVDGTSLLNSFGGKVNYQGQVFHSNNGIDGFSGGTELSSLHAEYTAVVHRPDVTVTKLVRDLYATPATATATTNNVVGSSSSYYEYQVTLTNKNIVPAYDIQLLDTLPNGLILLDGATDGIDNDGDGTADPVDTKEGLFKKNTAPLSGGTILFNQANTGLPTVGANFTQLDFNQTIVLKYRVQADAAILTSGMRVMNSAKATYTTLLGASGSMTTPIRSTGAVDGEGSSDVYGYATIAIGKSANTVFVDGVVFEDNGKTGGTAHDGIQNGGEKGLPKVKVELTDCSTNVYATVYSNGAGVFHIPVPASVANGSPLCVKETNLTAYQSTGGSPAAAYSIGTDQYSFTYNSTVSVSGILFGDIAPNTFLTDNVGMAMPGGVKFYPHQFTAKTAGTIAFSSAAVGSPTNPVWSNVLYEDSNCNQQLDGGEPQLTPTTALTLAADSYTCILDKQFVPSNMAYDSRNLVRLTATFTYAPVGGTPNANLPLKTYTRTDTTIVGQEGLVLHKAVDLPVAKPGQVITYTITYTNPTQGVLNTIVIHDATPAYTVFKSAQCLSKGKGITACAVGTPALAVGAVGSITWNLTGSLQPGGSGTVSYQVKVN